MNEHDLYRVMKDIDRKYTDELHRYADELDTMKRRKGTMKQKVKTKAPTAQFLPWKFGIGATVVACAVIAVSIGGGIISLDKQMQVGSNVGTSMSEQIAENTADEVKATITVQHEPVEIIDKLVVSGGNDSTMMKLPPEGAVQVLRNVEDAEACCQYSSENVADEPFDFRKKLTEDVFAQYDVLYFGFKDEQQPQNCYSVDLAGGSIAEDGTTLKLNFHALMFDPEYLPAHWCSTTEPDWNTYYFYTVPKDSLPDLYAIELSFEEYPIGEIPDEILAHANDLVDIEDNGYITKHTKLQEYLETTQEYLDWIMSMPKPKYITWEDNIPIPPEDCTEIQGAAEKQETADEKRVEIAGVTEFCSPVGIADEACFLVRSEADYQAMTALYPNIDCGFAESDDYDALFLLIPTEDADTYVSVTGITVSEATGRISLFIADDSSAYRDLETFTATKIVRLYIEKDALLPEFSGEFPQKVGMNVTWDYENTYDDFSAFCEAYPAATYIEVVS